MQLDFNRDRRCEPEYACDTARNELPNLTMRLTLRLHQGLECPKTDSDSVQGLMSTLRGMLLLEG